MLGNYERSTTTLTTIACLPPKIYLTKGKRRLDVVIINLNIFINKLQSTDAHDSASHQRDIRYVSLRANADYIYIKNVVQNFPSRKILIVVTSYLPTGT